MATCLLIVVQRFRPSEDGTRSLLAGYRAAVFHLHLVNSLGAGLPVSEEWCKTCVKARGQGPGAMTLTVYPQSTQGWKAGRPASGSSFCRICRKIRACQEESMVQWNSQWTLVHWNSNKSASASCPQKGHPRHAMICLIGNLSLFGETKRTAQNTLTSDPTPVVRRGTLKP